MKNAVTSLPELPKGWVWTKLGEVALDPQYGWTTSAVADGKLHVLRTTDITPGHVDWTSVPFCKDQPPDIGKYLLHDGDVVISRAGSVGYSHLVRNPPKSVFASYLIRFRPLINNQYFAMFLTSPSYWESVSEKSIGIALANVNASKLKQIPIPLAPLSEQHRIVAKVEELFTRLDVGIEALNKIKAQLQRYRQSVLKHAFEGKLTTEWRQAHKHELEPAPVLLDRIKQERQKPAKAKYREFLPLDTSELPELPDGWVWTRLGEIIDPSGEKADPAKAQNAPYVGLEHIEKDNGNLLGYGHANDVRSTKTRFHTGDLLYGRLRPYLNKAHVVDFDGICSTDILVFPASRHLSNKLILYRILRGDFVSFATTNMSGVQHPRVSFNILSLFPLALPPLPEQHIIVEEIQRRLSVADEIDRTRDQGLKQAERLRQSILKKAFEGKLVSQNPNDEPAEKLLERIKAERARQIMEKRVTVSKTRRRQGRDGD